MPNNKSKEINGTAAINDALILAGKKNKNVIYFGEGIDDPSSFYGTTKNLFKNFGKSRVIEMPLSENGIIGIAIGASMRGKIPIINLHRVEFALLAIEQIFNNAAKLHFISNGSHNVPIVIRLVIGRGWGQGPEHSQSLENIFSSIPGLKVLIPSFANDFKGMLLSAIEDKNPTIIIEHRWCHYTYSNVPRNYYKMQIDSPEVVKKGNDFTVVASSYHIYEAILANEILSQINVNIEVIDLRVTRPLNTNKIYRSLKKTGHLLIVDLGFVLYGIGSEIISQIVEKNKNILKSNPIRLGMPNYPTPSSRGYLNGHYPDAKKIIFNIMKILNISEHKQKKVQKILNEKLKGKKIDVPNDIFRGPF
tara:strand:- start:447 stop:1535 length:1089 start_codon:yes stop_codon:yes gene_type:complete